MKTILFVLLALVAILGVMEVMKPNSSLLQEAQAPINVLQSFNAWKAKYNIKYTNEDDESLRLIVFTENYNHINEENKKNSEYQLGENQFMGITNEEFVNTFVGKLVHNLPKVDIIDNGYLRPNEAFNWADKGAVTNVKNQGSCGACWAFSTTGVTEGYTFVNKGTLPNLSEQQLVDCAGPTYGNYGCNGGWPANALKYVKDKGLTTEEKYPYVGKQGKCKVDGGEYKINSVVATTSVSCENLIADIKIEPTSVSVDATNWQFYKSGVFNKCAKNVNHAVLATGYDASGNWIIKNSWGSSWGVNGYITLASGNTCDVCHYLTYAK